MDVDELGGEVGGGRRRRGDVEDRGHRTGHFQVVGKRRRAVDEHVGSRSPRRSARTVPLPPSIAPPRVGTGDAGFDTKTSGGSSSVGRSVVRRPSPLARVRVAAAAQIPRRFARARQRPFLLVAPHVRAHHVETNGRIRLQRRSRATAGGDRTRECSARGSRDGSCGCERRLGSVDRFGVTPRSDHQPRGGGDVARAPRAGCARSRRAGRAETDRTSRPSAAPAPEASRRGSRRRSPASRHRESECLTQSSKKPMSPTARSSASMSGKPVEPALQRVRRRPHVLGAAAAHRPEQRAGERERAARVEHAVKVGAGDLNHQRRAAVGRRRQLIGDGPLRVAERGAAPHPEPAVEPRLPLQPVERLQAVAPLVDERVVAAARLVSAARALNHGRVAALGPEAADDGRKQRVGRTSSRTESARESSASARCAAGDKRRPPAARHRWSSSRRRDRSSPHTPAGARRASRRESSARAGSRPRPGCRGDDQPATRRTGSARTASDRRTGDRQTIADGRRREPG